MIFVYYLKVNIFTLFSNPNGPGLLNWPQYTTRHSVQILDIPQATHENMLPARRKFWLHDVPDIIAGKTTVVGDGDGPTGSGWRTKGNDLLLITLFMTVVCSSLGIF